MPPVMRLNVDRVDGDGIAIQTSNTTVFANGELVMRIGDLCAPHGGEFFDHPMVSMVQGSPTVFAAGSPVCRVGDLASCSHVAEAPCSPDVVAG